MLQRGRVVLDNNIRFHIQRNRITQSIGIQIVGFGVVKFRTSLIRIMPIGIVNGVIYRQAKRSIRVWFNIGVYAPACSSHASFRGDHAINTVQLEMLSAFASIDTIVKVVRRNKTVHR